MSFMPTIDAWPTARIDELYQGIQEQDVLTALDREERTLQDLAALLSPKARPHLETMAREAQRLTRWHFGRTVSLYAPIYLSNLCATDCVYCGFSVRSKTGDKRITLKADALRKECEALVPQGFESVLLLTGDAPKAVNLDYIANAVEVAREYFPSVSVEIYALDLAGYERLAEVGIEGVTLYMETYDRETYSQVHLEGDKANYDFRLDAIERAGDAGARKISIGVLLGLCDWRSDLHWLALHAKHLQKKCWRSSLSLSFPRLLHTPDRFHVKAPVSDADLVQIILAMRLFLPEAGFNLSTRESQVLRDHLIPLGITSMSAGSSTRPGGYATTTDEVLEQFAIEDHRNPSDVLEAIRRAGYDPVWKDFDRAFDLQ